jgi:hypothetical protein
MDWNTTKIVDTVGELRYDYVTMTERDIRSKYAVFIEKFPKLYYTCIDPNFDMKTLDTLLQYRNKAENENIPNLVRDVTIGETMAKKYLYPVIGEPTIEQKKKAAAKVAQKYYSQQQQLASEIED